MGNRNNSSKSSNITIIKNNDSAEINEEVKAEEKEKIINVRRSITEKGKLITNRIYFK